MKRQVVAIHGGTSFDTHADYIDFIKTREISREKLKQSGDWKLSLAGDLGQDFEVLLPKMPNGTNVRYIEWRIWFDRCTEFMEEGVILIGHSLGGIFLAKYLSEKSLPKRVAATLMVAAPFDDCSTAESLTDFALPESLTPVAERGGKIYLIHSKDDPVVPFAEAGKYQRALPQAELKVFEDRGHFDQERFPELVELIQSL